MSDTPEKLSAFTTSSGICSDVSESTPNAFGPIQVVHPSDYRKTVYELTLYNIIRETYSYDGNGGCRKRVIEDIWKIGPLAPLAGSSGIYCATPVAQNKCLSLTVLSPTSKEIRPAGIGGSPTAELAAKAVVGTTPKAGVAVQFTADVTAKSGGHDHDDATRPKGTLSLAQGTTDANGEVKVTFKAEAVAGIHTIKATCASCTNSPASQEIKVKVPDLVEMPPDTKTPASYSLVGVITGVHNSSHWFALDSRNTLYKVVDTMSKTGWGTVGVNDGSLMWGGLFDVKGKWNPSPGGHSGHRTGNEVDLSFVNPKAIREAQRRATYTELCKKENTAFSVQTLWHQDDGYAPHFHLYLDGAGLTSQAKGGPCCESYKTTRPKKKKDGSPVLDTSGNPVQETVALCEETSPR